jgi:hypothetical protein
VIAVLLTREKSGTDNDPYIMTVSVNPSEGDVLYYTHWSASIDTFDVSFSINIPSNITGTNETTIFTLTVAPSASLAQFAVDNELNQTAAFGFELTSTKGENFTFTAPLVIIIETRWLWGSNPWLLLDLLGNGTWTDAADTCPVYYSNYTNSTGELTVHVCHLTQFGVFESASPTPLPTSTPTETPTGSPTETPTASPTETPTNAPTASPTETPTSAPTNAPTASPTETPTSAPTNAPTASPTETPTSAPTNAPTPVPIPTFNVTTPLPGFFYYWDSACVPMMAQQSNSNITHWGYWYYSTPNSICSGFNSTGLVYIRLSGNQLRATGVSQDICFNRAQFVASGIECPLGILAIAYTGNASVGYTPQGTTVWVNGTVSGVNASFYLTGVHLNSPGEFCQHSVALGAPVNITWVLTASRCTIFTTWMSDATVETWGTLAISSANYTEISIPTNATASGWTGYEITYEIVCGAVSIRAILCSTANCWCTW